MAFNQIELSDISDRTYANIVGWATFNKTNITPTEGIEYIDAETRLVRNCPTIDPTCISGNGTEFVLHIDAIEGDINVNVPINLIPSLANLSTIKVTTKFRQTFGLNKKGLNVDIKDLILSLLKEDLALVFDNIFTSENYDQLCAFIIERCVLSGLHLRYLSLPVTTLLYIASECNDLLDKLLAYLKREKVDEISVNEVFACKDKEYKKKFNAKYTKEYKDVLKFLTNLSNTNFTNTCLFLQQVPPEYSVSRNIVKSTEVISYQITKQKEISVPDKTIYFNLIEDFLKSKMCKNANHLLTSYKDALQFAKSRVYLFCNLDCSELLARIPTVLVQWTIVNQLDNRDINKVYTICHDCMLAIEAALKLINADSKTKNYYEDVMCQVVRRIGYFNLYYLWISKITENGVDYISTTRGIEHLENVQNCLGYMQLSYFESEHLNCLNYFF